MITKLIYVSVCASVFFCLFSFCLKMNFETQEKKEKKINDELLKTPID